MSFTGDLRKFKTKTEKAATLIFRGTALDLFARIIQRSPVDTGRFRANWQTEINSINRSTVNDTDKSGASATTKAKSKTGRADLGDSVFMVNNLPYSIRLERGSSDQAPRGMVRVTVAEFKRLIRERIRKHKRRT